MVSCGLITKLNKQKMNIQKRLQIEFEFLGEEQISANTALKIINDVFKEAETEQLTIGGVVKSFYCLDEVHRGKEDVCQRQCEYCRKNH